MKKETTVTDFLENEYSNAAMYILYRTTPSYIDGLKNSGRKVVYTLKKKNLSGEAKVSQFSSVVAAESQYIHGDASLNGVLVTLAQDYKGSNNLPILKGVGSFGTAFMHEASAPRYIFIKNQPYFEELFRKTDEEGLIKQNFEGSEIEPRFYVPTLPLALINGSTGIGVGYSCKILNRNVANIIKEIISKLDGKRSVGANFVPWWPNFTGTVEKISDNKWNIKGSATQNKKKVEITELPIGYELQQYLTILKKLKEKGTITKYEDYSEDDKYHFIVTLSDEEANKQFDEIFEDLKLSNVITESFTCIDENNSVIEFNSAKELFNKYFDFKIQSLQTRIENEIRRLENEAKELKEIYDFVTLAIKGKINFKAKRADLENQVQKLGFTLVQKLISMPLYSLTIEKAEEAKNKYEEKLNEIDQMKKETPKTIWLKDLEELKKKLK